MKRSTRLIGLGIVVASLFAGELYAQDFNFPGRLRQLDPVVENFEEPAPTFIKSAQAGFTFLALPVDARTAGMADAGIGTLGSAAGVLYNPAALAFMDGREAYFTQIQWIADMNMSVAGVTLNLPGTGTFGLALQTFDAGEFRATEIDPDPAGAGYKDLGTITTSNYAVTAAFGMKITDRFSIGASLKAAKQDLGGGNVLISGVRTTVDNSKTVLAADLATYFNTGFRNTALAMSVRNFSTELQYQRERFELPRNIQLGLLLDLISLSNRTPAPHHLDLAVDLTNPIDFDERIHFGVEYRYQRAGGSLGYAARAGYKTNHDTENYSVGAGLQFRNESGMGFRVDYAYRAFDSSFFDSVNIISGGVTF